MLPNKLKPDGLYKLIRVGKDNDGGYLVCEESIINSKSFPEETKGILFDPRSLHNKKNTTTINEWEKLSEIVNRTDGK